MSTFQREAALLATVRVLLVTVQLILRFLATNTRFAHELKTWGTVAKMTLQRTRMSAWENFQAWTTTRWLNLTTFYWRIKFFNTTGAKQWISWVNFAWLAEANVAKVIACMSTARKGFVTYLETDVSSFRITSSFFDITADCLTLVLFATLHLVADLCAREGLCTCQLLWCHQLFSEFSWIIDSKTCHFAFIFTAFALLVHFFVTSLAFVCMARLFALMLSTCQEFFAFVLAKWNWVCACLSWASNQRLNSVVAARTVSHSFRSSWAAVAFSLMASPLAVVLATVQKLSTYSAARLTLASARSWTLFLATETRLSYNDLTGFTMTFMASTLTFVAQTIQKFCTLVFACKLCSRSKLARNTLFFFATVAWNTYIDWARRATSRMT